MKKPITLVTAVVTAAAMSVNAFASTYSYDIACIVYPANGLDYQDNVSSNRPALSMLYEETNDIIVCVDIKWGSMKFIYNPGDWDPTTHEYKTIGEGGTASGFTPNETGGDKVTITSNTGMALTATVAYEADTTTLSGITGKVYAGTASDSAAESVTADIVTAGGTAADGSEQPKAEFTVTLEGTPSAQTTDFTKVGTLTITLT